MKNPAKPSEEVFHTLAGGCARSPKLSLSHHYPQKHVLHVQVRDEVDFIEQEDGIRSDQLRHLLWDPPASLYVQ